MKEKDDFFSFPSLSLSLSCLSRFIFDVFEYTSGRLIRCRRRANSTSTSTTSTEASLGQTYEKKEKEDLPLSPVTSYIHLSFYLLSYLFIYLLLQEKHSLDFIKSEATMNFPHHVFGHVAFKRPFHFLNQHGVDTGCSYPFLSSSFFFLLLCSLSPSLLFSSFLFDVRLYMGTT